MVVKVPSSSSLSLSSSLTRHNSQQSNINNKKKKAIIFHNVHIRYYNVSMSHHTIPTTGGVPIGIVGNHIKEETIDLNYFEATKPKVRRKEEEFYINRMDRMNYLIKIGFTTRQIGKHTNQCEKIQKQRESNLKHRGTLLTTIIDDNDTTMTMTREGIMMEMNNNNDNNDRQSCLKCLITFKILRKLLRSNNMVAANSTQ